MHKLTKNDAGRPVIETFENENVRITRFLNGETTTEFKPDADPKVISIYKKLIEKRDI